MRLRICVPPSSWRLREAAQEPLKVWSLGGARPACQAWAGGAVTSDNPSQLEFRVLGPLEIRSPARPVSLGGGKPRALLADLLIHLGQIVSVDRLIDDLWGAAAPATARHALEVHVSQLRKALGPQGGPLATRAPGYVLDVDPQHLDAFLFERLLGEARRSSG